MPPLSLSLPLFLSKISVQLVLSRYHSPDNDNGFKSKNCIIFTSILGGADNANSTAAAISSDSKTCP